MEHTAEPKIQQGVCSYCGDAQVNHRLYYLENFFSSLVEAHMVKVASHAPKFLKDFAGLVPVFLFKTLVFLGLAHFSRDINKANSFRSRIIWEEAKRRGIEMEQIIIGKKPLDWYRAKFAGKTIYFESIPIQSEFLDFKKDWDNKIILKKELSKHKIPVPEYKRVPFFRNKNIEGLLSKIKPPVIVKPQLGSRARHTITNIHTIEHLKDGINIAGKISPHLVVEEHLQGYVCRATLIGGVLAGFYRGKAPFIVGDGKKTIRELIEEKDKERNERVEQVRLGEELYAHIARSGFNIEDVLPDQMTLTLSHRIGRLFGGTTKEMIDELHPSFTPILEKAASVVGLSVVGFDCIIPDPTKEEDSQRWGIIECNTLPFIDLHYYALEGKPRNIAGMVWDLWDN
jgi:D-alanine-D-alanine ligase-like ATP-grasp enzyme